MKEIIACELEFSGTLPGDSGIVCIPFQEEHWTEYMQIYNECFYEMRKALEVEPFHYYSDYSQMKDKAENTFLFLKDGIIAGAVSCYGHEIDDLIVNRLFQKQGLGRKLLLWGMSRIREQGHEAITLHVAEWNQNALHLYLKTGFHITKRERVR